MPYQSNQKGADMEKRIGDPWMPAGQYGKSLSGLGLNLLVVDIEIAIAFQTEVLGAKVIYSDPDIATLEVQGSN